MGSAAVLALCTYASLQVRAQRRSSLGCVALCRPLPSALGSSPVALQRANPCCLSLQAYHRGQRCYTATIVSLGAAEAGR